MLNRDRHREGLTFGVLEGLEIVELHIFDRLVQRIRPFEHAISMKCQELDLAHDCLARRAK